MMGKQMQLPEDVIEEIFSNLQVKDVLRFKSVCKNWFSIMSTPRFINLHLNRSISAPSHRRIFMPFPRTYKTVDYYRNHQLRVSELPIPEETVGSGTYFVGTSHGLICYLHSDAKRLFIWNPALRVSKSLNTDISIEPPCYEISFFWLGRDPFDNDEYKLIVGIRSMEDGFRISHTHLVRPCNYDPKSTTTREIIDDQLAVLRSSKDEGTLLHGIVHWLSDQPVTADHDGGGPHRSYAVFTYDLGCGSVGEMWTPVRLSCRGSIGEIGGCLCAIMRHCGSFEVWVMKEYGVKESWSKSMVISPSIGCDRTSSLSRLVLVGVNEDGDLILSCAPIVELLIYNVAKKRFKTLVSFFETKTSLDSNGCGLARMYVETLVSP